MSGLKPEKSPEETSEEKTKEKSEKPAGTSEKDKKVARDIVKLKHVETQVQKATGLSAVLKEKSKQETDAKEKLSDDAFAVISAISESKRLFLQRIQIVVNQSRVPLGKQPLREAEFRQLMADLVKRDILKMDTVTTEGLGPREVYSLTQKGKELLE
ncbi:MAG: hypothetical protein RBG13Loki_3411 [Promethearchaeota archaeon CR_4]|nr:MAG: hypothetical protein RBG13Loki_3411 [Candidatus Lokiarchaeota archaeon CR_4]